MMFYCLYTYVCMFVCLSRWMSGLSTTYNVTVCRSISMRFSLFLQKETGFPRVCRFGNFLNIFLRFCDTP